jgi:hypothetical protein
MFLSKSNFAKILMKGELGQLVTKVAGHNQAPKVIDEIWEYLATERIILEMARTGAEFDSQNILLSDQIKKYKKSIVSFVDEYIHHMKTSSYNTKLRERVHFLSREKFDEFMIADPMCDLTKDDLEALWTSLVDSKL